MSKKKNGEYEEEYLYDEYEDRNFSYDEDYDEYEEEPYDHFPHSPNRRESSDDYSAPKSRRHQTSTSHESEERPMESSGNSPSLLKEHQEMLQELLRLEDTVTRLTEQVAIKQDELNRMATLLTEKDEGAEAAVEAKQQEKQQLLEELAQVKAQNAQHDQQLASVCEEYEKKIIRITEEKKQLEEEFKNHEKMKSQLANIVIETKEQGRTIVERAQWEAKQIKERAERDAHAVMADAALELRVVNQEAAQYKERLTSFRDESNHLMDKLIASSEHIAHLDHFKQLDN